MQSAPGILLQQVTIANGTSLSGAASLGGGTLVGILLPSAWTTAGLAFQASLDGVNFFSVQDNSAEITVAAAASVYVSVPPNLQISALWIKVRSGTEGSNVNQGADRVITLMIRKPAIESLR